MSRFGVSRERDFDFSRIISKFRGFDRDRDRVYERVSRVLFLSLIFNGDSWDEFSGSSARLGGDSSSSKSFSSWFT